MKNKKYLISLVILAFFSCEVLNEEIVSDVTADHYTTLEGLNDAVNATYAQLRPYYGSEWGATLTVLGTDEYTNGGEGGFHYMNQYTGALNSESSPFWEIWQNFYQGINTCNTVITRIQDVNLPQDEKSAKIGEARFIRAHYYFELVRLFGPIHLTLEETIGVETLAERTDEKNIYTAIVNDLEFAIENLPETQNDFGRVTASAAKHMLSLVLLTRGYRDFSEADDYERAASLAIEIIENSHHRLLDDYFDVFDPENEQNEAIIWSIQWTEDPILNRGGANGNYAYFRPWYEVYHGGLQRALGPGYGRPYVRFRPTSWALENFRPIDIDSRFNKNFQVVWYYNEPSGIPEGAALGDTALWITDKELSLSDVNAIEARLPGVNLFSWNLNNMDDPWYRQINIWPSLEKFSDWKQPSLGALAGVRDHIVYRIEETYLNAVEALIMAGNTSDALKYINVIRRRAAYPGKEAEMEIASAELDMDFYLDERARELYGERKRWFDLKRTGKLVERVKLYNPEATSFIQEHHLLRPIPANQINRTENNYLQNPGY